MEKKNIKRRDFIGTSLAAAAGTLTITNTSLLASIEDNAMKGRALDDEIPWYKRVKRWGQINITEDVAANLIRWASKDDIPLVVEGVGLVDCNLYQQPGRIILHITNLTSAATWRKPIDELIPIGPLSVKVKLIKDVKGKSPKLLVAGQKITATVRDHWSQFNLPKILDHEVIVLT